MMRRSKLKTIIATWKWERPCARRSSMRPAKWQPRPLSRRCRFASSSCQSLCSAAWVVTLFAPLAMAVVFAMLASYFLSRTLVPTMVLFLLAAEERQAKLPPPARRSIFRRIGDGFERGFERLTRGYEGLLTWALA